LDYRKVLDLGEVVSRKSLRVGGGDGFLEEALDMWVDIGKLLKGW